MDAEPVLHVLLVEDDEDDSLLVADLLEAWPEFRVSAVPTVAAAEAHVARRPVDCVLLDLNLPDAVGLDALGRVLGSAPELAVVVLTGDVDGRQGTAAVAAGAQDYLVKGRSDGETIVRAIRYAVERRSGERWRRAVAVAHAHESENARLQRGLLPAPILTAGGGVLLGTTYRPGRERQLLGGDFYDVVQTPDGAVHAIVGDVCGHGPDEAALGVRLRMAWRTLMLADPTTRDLFPVLDRVLDHERDDPCLFITLAQVTVAADGRSALVRSAGHPAPMLAQGGAVRALDECPAGPALGLGGDVTWPASTVALGPDSTLLLFTDGLYEGRARPDDPARLGLDGLLDLTAAALPAGAAVDDAALARLVTEIERRHGGPLTDDVAVLAVRVRPTSAPAARPAAASTARSPA